MRARVESSSGLMLVLVTGPLLLSCSAATTALNKQDLDVQTHMSDTIFLDPVSQSKKTIYIGIRNTSDHPELNLRAPVAQQLQDRGYTIVTDPDSAHFIMQLNVLQAGPIDPSRREALLSSGYGSGLDALLVGGAAAGITNYATGNSGAALGVGLGIAAASFLADQLIKDVYYTVVTDIQIAARPVKGGKVHEVTETDRSSGSGSARYHASSGAGASEGVSNYGVSGSANSTHRSQSIETSSDFVKYNVRDVAYANQMNLKFANAAPILTERLASSVANLFE